MNLKGGRIPLRLGLALTPRISKVRHVWCGLGTRIGSVAKQEISK